MCSVSSIVLLLTLIQEVCSVSSIVLLLTLIGHDMVFISFSNVFHRFQPCERMRKHAFAGPNTQQLVAKLINN